MVLHECDLVCLGPANSRSEVGGMGCGRGCRRGAEGGVGGIQTQRCPTTPHPIPSDSIQPHPTQPYPIHPIPTHSILPTPSCPAPSRFLSIAGGISFFSTPSPYGPDADLSAFGPYIVPSQMLGAFLLLVRGQESNRRSDVGALLIGPLTQVGSSKMS